MNIWSNPKRLKLKRKPHHLIPSLEQLEDRRLLAVDINLLPRFDDLAVSNTNLEQSVAFEQVGGDLDGEASGDQFGHAVSLSADGAVLAVGAPFNGGNGFESGHVRVYEQKNTGWERIGGDIDGEAADDRSGHPLTLSTDGKVLAISAYKNDGNGNNSGQVRVYRRQNDTWVKMGEDIDGEAAEDHSGSSVSLSADGSVLAISAQSNDGNGTSSGHVRVFRYVSDSWVRVGIDIDGENEDDNFGYSTSLSADGSVLAIGGILNDGSALMAGHVQVYREVNGQWIKIGDDIDGEAAVDFSGWSVSLSADAQFLAVGAPFNDGNGSNSGQVRVYRQTNDNWQRVGLDLDGEAAGDCFGTSVSLNKDGSLLAIGGWKNNGNGDNSGHVQLYRQQNNNWVQIGADIDGEMAGDQAGYSISLSADGSVLAIGATLNSGNGTDSGHARVYVINPNNRLELSLNSSEQTINLTGISAGGDESQPLRVIASSSNTNLIADPTVIYTSAESTGQLKFTPLGDQNGVTTITVTVEDGGLDNDLATGNDNAVTTRTFDVTVTPDGDAPTLDAIADLTIDEDASEQTVDLKGITAGGGENQPLRVTATSSHTGLIANPTVIYTSAESTGQLKFTPLADLHGDTMITVTVEDGGLDGDLGTSGDNGTVSRTFDVIVNPVNDVPTINTIDDVTIDEDASEQTVQLTGVTAGGGEIQPMLVSASSSNSSLIGEIAVDYSPINTTGTLKFTAVADAHGVTTITVTVEDGGLDNDLATGNDNAVTTR
ncbi:MAG: hypothetical protein GY922_08630, partial [Proteobacteria bacterium]|nr:hypothetical protein [Pseudomonadota bacterium]